ncbi:MAG: HAD family hydrolase [Clostridium sp.]|uniref:HAD family hydrolase n=1 Tax=Clostridium sp. TaxID=1506 RepID=UPI003D6CCD98
MIIINKIIFWDFQGTLAHNDWMISKALHKVLLYNEPNTKITIEQFKKLKILGIPWQDYRHDYSYLTIQGAWWKLVESTFEEAYKLLYIDADRANKYAKQAHHELVKPDEFKLYDDTVEVLTYFKLNGWKNIILSNHIPELPDIVNLLGLKKCIYKCISSANIGFEKPNHKIYEFALKQFENPQKVWMVGDSLLADVKGPEKAGIKGILVRTPKVDNIDYYSKDLLGLKEIIY